MLATIAEMNRHHAYRLTWNDPCWDRESLATGGQVQNLTILPPEAFGRGGADDRRIVPGQFRDGTWGLL